MAKKLTNKTSYGYSKIRWKEEDYKRLHKAVNAFNKEVKKHQDLIPSEALPKIKQYKDVKSQIYSRKDLELAISTMENVKKKHAFDLVSSEANKNVKFTKWELQTAKRYDYRNQVKLQTQYNKVLQDIKDSAKVELDTYGNPVLNREGKPIAKTSFPQEGKARLESYLEETNFDMLLRSRDYERSNELLERIYRRGTDEFEFRKAEIYKENYLKMFEGYENLDNYEEVVDKLKSIEAKDFYNFIKENDFEGADNFMDHYDNRMAQVDFNNFARKLGVDVDDTIEPVTENIF